MKKNLANQIAKLWNENFAGSTSATKTKAFAEGENVYIYNVGDDNDGHVFFHTEELADVTRTFNVSSIVALDYDTNKVHARLF